MARPQPAQSGVLQTRRPAAHPLAPVTDSTTAEVSPAPAAAEQGVSPAATSQAASAAPRNAATAPGRNAATAADRIAAKAPVESETPDQPDLRKFSIRVPPHQHRHIKVTAAQRGMSIQDLAVEAIAEYLDRLGSPLPPV